MYEPRDLDAYALARLWVSPGDVEPRTLDAAKLAALPAWQGTQPLEVVDYQKFSSVSGYESKLSETGAAFASVPAEATGISAKSGQSGAELRELDPRALMASWGQQEPEVLDHNALARMAGWLGVDDATGQLSTLPGSIDDDALLTEYLRTVENVNAAAEPHMSEALAGLLATKAWRSNRPEVARCTLETKEHDEPPHEASRPRESTSCCTEPAGRSSARDGACATEPPAMKCHEVANRRSVLPPFAGKRDVTERWSDDGAVARWKELSQAVLVARNLGAGGLTSPLLVEESMKETGAVHAPLYVLWAIDNYMIEGAYSPALGLAKGFLSTFSDRVFRGAYLSDLALRAAAECAGMLGDLDAKEAHLRHLIKIQTAGERGDASALYRLGTLYEENGRREEAVRAFASAARHPGHFANGQLCEYAARDVMRLTSGRSVRYRQRPELVAQELLGALRKRDPAVLARLASQTHFVVGYGGHLEFADRSVFLNAMLDDLHRSVVTGDPARLEGHGGKRYLRTQGWVGLVFFGSVRFAIVQCPDGWEWRGVVWDDPTLATTALLREQFPMPEGHPNQPLAIEIKAPWPAGIAMQAGGQEPATALLAAELVAGVVAGTAAALACIATLYFYPVCAAVAIPASIAAAVTPFEIERWRLASRSCGFALAGSYYNQGGHVSGRPGNPGRFWDQPSENQYAIDFVRYERLNLDPRNLGYGTKVLAVHSGIPNYIVREYPTGSPVNPNEVYQVLLADPADPPRYVANYAHLDGRNRIMVSEFMWIEQGTVLGYLDNTGNSTGDHLHFEIHDATLHSADEAWADLGRTTRPTPMDVDESGNPQTLDGDGLGHGIIGDDGRCIFSTNAPVWAPPTAVSPPPDAPTTSRAYCMWVAWEVMRVSIFHGVLLLALCDRLPPDAP